MKDLSEAYWNQQWESENTGWDIGYPSPAIISYFEKITNKDVSILIPGCGNAYEAKALLELGFFDITILDISAKAIENLKQTFHFTEDIKIVHQDFFEFQGAFDYIIEQTFFSALHPSLRKKYVRKMKSLLSVDGILIGLLFNKVFGDDGPPFGGDIDEYRTLFSKDFNFLNYELSDNSIPQRLGNELFIEFQVK